MSSSGALLGDGDGAGRALDQLEDELAEVCGQLNVLHARLVDLVADAMASGAWAQWGIHTPSHWLALKAGLSRAHAHTIVRLAARRHELPATFEAFERGELSVDQVAPVVAKAPAWADAEIAEFAKHATVTQLRSTLASYAFEEQPVADEDRSPDLPPPSTDESFSLTQVDDGSWRIGGRLDHDHGLVLDAAVREIRDALFRESGSVPTAAEILIEMANRSLDGVSNTARRDRYRVHVHLDERRELLDPFGHCLAPWIRELITCDAHASVVWTRPGTPIAVGSTSPAIPGATRRHVLLRDRGCRVPGCGVRRRLDVHHIVHREHHGTNDPSNLMALCPRHHRMHHRGELGIVGDAETADGLTFTGPHGRPLTGASVARPPTQAPPTPASRYRHPSGGRLLRRDVHFNDPRRVMPSMRAGRRGGGPDDDDIEGSEGQRDDRADAA